MQDKQQVEQAPLKISSSDKCLNQDIDLFLSIFYYFLGMYDKKHLMDLVIS